MATRTFIIGLPKQLQQRIEAFARRNDFVVDTIKAARGKERSPKLLPHPNAAVHKFRSSYDECNDLAVLVLPYATLPHELSDELEVLQEDLDGSVKFVEAGVDDWPTLGRNKKFEHTFLQRLYSALEHYLVPETPPARPSAHLEECLVRQPLLRAVEGAAENIDQLPQHRHSFIRTALDALCEICGREAGDIGPFHEFFQSRGLHFATTGGVGSRLHVNSGTEYYGPFDSHWHLKAGDRTTPAAATRIYFQNQVIKDVRYIIILYIGQHPEEEISGAIEID